MSKDGGSLPPQVIRRGDEYVVLNVDLKPLGRGQRAAVGAQVWEQVKTLMQTNGEPVYVDQVNRRVAQTVGAAAHAVDRAKLVIRRRPDLLEPLLAGELTVIDALRRAGFHVTLRLDEGRPSKSKLYSNYYGKGDKFTAAMTPLSRYLRSWKKRGFEFRHVNPAEAKRRLKQVDETISQLQEAREDLVKRSHVATSRAPSEKGKGKRKK